MILWPRARIRTRFAKVQLIPRNKEMFIPVQSDPTAGNHGNGGNKNLRDKLDLSNKNFLDFIVNQRRFLLIIVTIITLFLAWFVPNLRTDPSLESGVDKASEAYKDHQQFKKIFGNEEFVLIALKGSTGAKDPGMLEALARITNSIESLDKIEEVVSLSNIKLFQQRGDLFGNYPILEVCQTDLNCRRLLN